jgi:hypothetical protein
MEGGVLAALQTRKVRLAALEVEVGSPVCWVLCRGG